MYHCEPSQIAERSTSAGANIIDFQAARAASLVKRCKGPPREANVLVRALVRAGATALPVWIHPVEGEIGIEWNVRPRVSDLLLAETVSLRLGYRTGTHAFGGMGFTFLSVAA